MQYCFDYGNCLGMNELKPTHKHLLTVSQTELFNKINNKRMSIGRLSNTELIDSIVLNDCGLVKFDRTKKGNPSKFLIRVPASVIDKAYDLEESLN